MEWEGGDLSSTALPMGPLAVKGLHPWRMDPKRYCRPAYRADSFQNGTSASPDVNDPHRIIIISNVWGLRIPTLLAPR